MQDAQCSCHDGVTTMQDAPCSCHDGVTTKMLSAHAMMVLPPMIYAGHDGVTTSAHDGVATHAHDGVATNAHDGVATNALHVCCHDGVSTNAPVLCHPFYRRQTACHKSH